MKVSSRKMNSHNDARQKTALRRTLDPLLPAILVIGAAALLSAKPASAIELSQLQVNSTLGQPLSASIRYVLNPHEQLHSYCISLTRSAETGVQSLTRANIKIVGDRIVITGSRPINEPMLAMRVAVNCPYTVKLARDFVVMINPAGTADPFAIVESSQPVAAPVVANVAAPVSQPEIATAPLSVPAVSSVPGRAPVPATSVRSESPVFVGDDYRVQTGDTVSKIANRIDGRTVGLWPAVNAIFVANPEAFVANDKNQLIAGSMLTIPDLRGYDVSPVAAAEPAPVESFVDETTLVADTNDGYAAYDSDSNQWAEEEVVVDDAADAYDPETSYTPASTNDYEVYDSNNDQPVEEETVAVDDGTDLVDDTAVLASGNPDTGLEPESVVDTATDPVAEVAAPVSEDATPKSVVVAKPLESPTSNSTSWLVWAGGGAALFILGLLFASRRKLGDLFGGDNAERVEPELEEDAVVTQKSHVLSDVDYPLDDVVEGDHDMQLDADLGDGIGPNENAAPEIAFAETTDLDMALASTVEVSGALELDADLGAGTGLQDGTDLDVAQDFGFSPTGENAAPMDLELPVEVEVGPEEFSTEIIPPQRAEETTVLEDEVPPSERDDDTEYDLSMIVDATKQTVDEGDLVAKDLNAMQLDAEQRNIDDGAYTLSKEVDFETLEQDYEEELTQTQAVNEEIARAAVELAERMQSQDEEEVLDVTAEMPAQKPAPAVNDATADESDATALNEALTVNEEITVKISLDDDDTVDAKKLG